MANIKDFKSLSKPEINEKLNELHKQFMELQFKRRSGVEKPHMFKQIRKDIARILTVMNAKKEGSKANVKQEKVPASTRAPSKGGPAKSR